MAVPDTVCSQKSVGISVDLNTYEPHLLAGTMAHMIGHNIGMAHDDGSEYENSNGTFSAFRFGFVPSVFLKLHYNYFLINGYMYTRNF